MTNILFVDDDPVILSSLRNLFHCERRRWAMSFAVGGSEALAAFDRECFDVVVSDMRMPVMDGVELLHAVKDRSPASGRIILTGYSEPEALARARLIAHEVLNKPCCPKVLRDAIVRYDGGIRLQTAASPT